TNAVSRILYTDQAPPSPDPTTGSNWEQACYNKRFLQDSSADGSVFQKVTNADPRWEWVPAHNHIDEQDTSGVLSGTIVYVLPGDGFGPGVSSEDVPFTHPFGNDAEFFIAPDPKYTGLLAGSNGPPNPSSAGNEKYSEEYYTAFQVAHTRTPQSLESWGLRL